MRRLALFALLGALALPASSAAREYGVADGTLSVHGARGSILVAGRGAVIGSFNQGWIRIVDPVEGDGSGPIVVGEEFHKELSDTADLYRGTKVRFRLIGGTFRVRIQGRGINLSVVGKASVTLNGAGTVDDGEYAVNGGDYSSIPEDPLTFQLFATSP
jgi:hypothetical protein